MRFGAEGALYLTDWITGWDSKDQGRIWKLDAPAAAGSAVRKEVQTLLRADFRAPAGRGRVEPAAPRRHARPAEGAVRAGAPRRRSQPLLAAARDSAAGLGRLHAIWGIAQLARRQPAHAAQLAAVPRRPATPEVRAQAAKMIGDVRYAAAGDRALPLLKDDAAPRVQFFAAEALGRIAYKPAVSALVSMLADERRSRRLPAARRQPGARVDRRRGGARGAGAARVARGARWRR